MPVFKKNDFKKVLQQLNPAQKLAVNTIDGPVLVVAGPGTGKTQVLSARIANILKLTDTNPSSILALTFTDSASVNMRRRLISMIGETGYYVKISTFHSFCVEVIQTHPDYFAINRGSEPLSELERYQIFQTLIKELKLDILKPINAPFYYLKDMIKAISDLKREGINENEFKNIISSQAYLKNENIRNQQKNKELSKIYSSYQKRIRDQGRYDFEDMIQLVVEKMQNNKNLLSDYQERILYFLVDEYQDTNNSQNKLLKILTKFWGNRANLFVVGDPHQSIFRFQGASVENILSFIGWYPNATVIRLDTGYRSPQLFYDSASQVIRHNQLTENKKIASVVNAPIKSVIKNDGEIIIQKVPSQLVEYIFVAEKIKKLLKNVRPEEVAVLYRNNADAKMLREILDKWEIPYEIDAGDDILKTESIRELLQLFLLILKVKNGEDHSSLLFEVLSYPWFNDNILAVIKIAQASNHSKLSIEELLTKGFEYYNKLNIENKTTMIEFRVIVQLYKKIVEWGMRDTYTVFPQFFEEVIIESRYLEWASTQDNKIVLLTNLSTLFREIKSSSESNHAFRLKDFIFVIETILNFKIELKAEDLNVTEGAIKLSTVHRAKGQEWDYVFIIQCIDGKWGNTIDRELIPLPNEILRNTDVAKKEINEDERRLFYVAITRARKNLVISYPQTIITQTRSKTVTPSMFISEIPKDFIVEGQEFIEPKDSVDYLKSILSPPKRFFYKRIDESYFLSLVDKFNMSSTALNTYLKDDQEFVRNFLLRVPKAKTASMAFGSAVHKSLEVYYRQFIQSGTWLAYKDFVGVFEAELRRELLTEEEFRARLKYGKNILKGYYDNYLTNVKKPYLVEKFFGGTYKPVMLDDIKLSGRIDRIDWIDKDLKLVKVIDYKTGSPKTVGEIEGTTKSSILSEREIKLPLGIRSPYKRQLLFYRLLTTQDTTFKEKVVEGEFDFIEPDKSRGVFVKRSFVLEDSDLNHLKNLIRSVMKEIRELKFLN